MTRGKKKRGASSGTDSSGRGGKRIAVTPSSLGGSGSSGSGRTSSGKDGVKADAATKKMNEALASAFKLSNACKQYTLKDVKTIDWVLTTDEEGNIHSSFASFKDVLVGRRDFFKGVRSLLIRDVVVTQPSSNETYHIVNSKVDGVVVAQLLFRQSDGYLMSFRLLSTEEVKVWEGWYYFKDVILPSFCEESAMMGLESGYTDFDRIKFGKAAVSSIIKCLCAFTRDNCTSSTFGEHNRVLLFETLMAFFGECQRSGVFLKFAENHFESVDLVQVTLDLSKHRNSWANLSTAMMALYLGFLQQRYGVNGWEAILKEGMEQMKREVREFTNLGHNSIERFFEYQDTLDANGQRVPDFTPSMENLLGKDSTHLLHLIKYDEQCVLDILLTRMKLGKKWSEGDY